MPMSAALECRGVVDPVAGHRHDLAAGLQGAHQAKLLLGFDAREDRHLGHQAP